MNDHLPYEQSDLYRLRHTAAHVMAQAVLELFPDAKLAIGPPIDDGFYYDFDLGQDESGRSRSFGPDDLPAIEARMRRIIAADHPLAYREIGAEEARALFVDQPFKLELIAELAAAGEALSTYRQDHFEDLCRGPHVAGTGALDPDAVRLLHTAGAYWRGDERRAQLQRIYGTAWFNQEELDAYLERLELARSRDHRRLGPQLGLFHLDETAPGMPYWLPRGVKLLQALIQFWREEHEAWGYQEIVSPLINDRALYERSGHWDHYRTEMFIAEDRHGRQFGLKPMNCPNAMVVYGLEKRSYRDLPLRLADTDLLHRNERSGTLHGLLRVQSFRQDDAHLFVAEEQIAAEFHHVLDVIDRFYAVFELPYRLRLGTRPDDFIGDVATWKRAEEALRAILEARVGAGNFEVADGDGAFYGPKIHILMKDALGREWQMGTVQLDFQLPRRFDLTYTASDGGERTPVVVHRVIYGSLERFIGLLIRALRRRFSGVAGAGAGGGDPHCRPARSVRAGGGGGVGTGRFARAGR